MTIDGWWILLDALLLIIAGAALHFVWTLRRLVRIAEQRSDRRAVYTGRFYQLDIELKPPKGLT